MVCIWTSTIHVYDTEGVNSEKLQAQRKGKYFGILRNKTNMSVWKLHWYKEHQLG